LQACEVMLKNFPEAPCVPLLTDSLRLYLEGIPCVVIDREKRQLYFDLSREQELFEFYELYEENKVDNFAISKKYAPGLYALMDILKGSPHPELKLITFEIPGPFSWGISTLSNQGVPVWYDENIRDLLVKAMRMKIMWVEKYFAENLPGITVLIIVGEPSLSLLGSPFVSINKSEIPDAINNVLSAVKGLRAVHCCANINWSILTEGNMMQVINFDAFKFSENLALSSGMIGEFIERGGMIAWGVVPVDEETLVKQDIDSLTARFEQGVQLFVNEGIDRKRLLEHSFITPCCTTFTLPVDLAERAFRLTGEVSRRMQDKYF
jgi:hypothetical protein